jgi:hypothetical protein
VKQERQPIRCRSQPEKQRKIHPPLEDSSEEEGFDAVEVLLGVDADGVEVGGFDVDVDVVFEEAELFEALGLFEGAGGQSGEAQERGFAIGV